MAHLIVEYSANITQKISIKSLIDHVHLAAIDSAMFPPGGLRTRAAQREHYAIADNDISNAFVHIVVRVGHGRNRETKYAAMQLIFDRTSEFLQQVYDQSPLAISLELVEIDPAYSFKKNNIHEYVKKTLRVNGRYRYKLIGIGRNMYVS